MKTPIKIELLAVVDELTTYSNLHGRRKTIAKIMLIEESGGETYVEIPITRCEHLLQRGISRYRVVMSFEPVPKDENFEFSKNFPPSEC
jgi:hypothetical protein